MSALTKERERDNTAVHRNDIAFAVTCLLLAVVVAVLLIPQDQTEMLRTFTPEHIKLLDMFDSRGQQRAHRVLVTLLGALGIAALVSRRRGTRLALPNSVSSLTRLLRENAGVGVVAVVTICLLLYWRNQPASNYLMSKAGIIRWR